MKNIYIHEKKSRLNCRNVTISVLLGLLIVCTLYLLRPDKPERQVESGAINATNATNATETNATASVEIEPETPRREPVQTYMIKDGDTLSAIFEQHQIGLTTMYQIMDADEQILALDTLRPGNKLTFWFNDRWDLEKMELYINPAHQVVYNRVDADNFEFQEIVHEGVWVQEALTGDIEGSFFISAQKAGLNEQEVANVAELLKGRVNFRRDMRLGDTFQVVRKQQFVGDEFTGESQILGVRILCRSRAYDAYLFSDGKYYDHDGNSLIRAFSRYPFRGNYRLSSPFNPRRHHPVTGRISPHNGADFSMPSGTPVFAPGDGVVVRTMRHRYAGNYIEIRHSDRYSTRYLHLSKFLVRKGQRVKRGDKIALSGNTGRSTGPHLHYEFHIAGRPVNPMTAPIPVLTSIPKSQRGSFKSHVAELLAAMDQALSDKNAKASETPETQGIPQAQ